MWDAELQRLTGTVLLAENRFDEGQASLQQAIRIARDGLLGDLRPMVPSHPSSRVDVSYSGPHGYGHTARTVRSMAAHVLMPWIHRVFSNLKRWGLGSSTDSARSTSTPI
jgi:hypothetical protein